jgi:hypothetical protein
VNDGNGNQQAAGTRPDRGFRRDPGGDHRRDHRPAIGADIDELGPGDLGTTTVLQDRLDGLHDNSDMANNYSGWSSAKVDCKFAANDQAKYGTPKWPSWGSEFGSFRRGDDYKSGKVTLIEPDAQFSNGFGAMVHVRATCQYDLREKRVLSVNLVAAR